jgi:hypothetical protein
VYYFAFELFFLNEAKKNKELNNAKDIKYNTPPIAEINVVNEKFPTDGG